MSPVNTDELELALMLARQRVLKIQTKLHRWARDDPHRRFDDLFNLVADPAFLLVAWDRVSGNKGAATAGVDRRTASSIAATQGVEEFLDELRFSVKDRSFHPLPVRERMIPKTGGTLRRLGIPTVADRVVQASLKLVLEPIFEADSCRVPTVSVRDAGLMTRWPKCATSRRVPGVMTGSSRETSRPVSTRSTTPP
jgi:RNA-directed DNA polymerase